MRTGHMAVYPDSKGLRAGPYAAELVIVGVHSKGGAPATGLR